MSYREYVEKTQFKMRNVLMEYQPDLDECVCDIHKDVINKFPEFSEKEKLQFSTHVMQSMLFAQICRVITPYGNVRDWKNVFRDMEDSCVEVCSNFYFGMKE